MKSKSLFIVALVMLSSVVATFGKEEPSKAGLAVVPVKGTEVFKVIYKGENSGKVKLNIYDASGVVIFSETINSVDGFIRPLNFGGLQFGEYTVELVDATGKKSEKISYVPHASTIKSIHVAKIANQDKYLVAIASNDKEVVHVRIFDNTNQLVHDETKEFKGNFAQVYSIKDLNPGFTFQITDTTGNIKTVKY